MARQRMYEEVDDNGRGERDIEIVAFDAPFAVTTLLGTQCETSLV